MGLYLAEHWAICGLTGPPPPPIKVKDMGYYVFTSLMSPSHIINGGSLTVCGCGLEKQNLPFLVGGVQDGIWILGQGTGTGTSVRNSCHPDLALGLVS